MSHVSQRREESYDKTFLKWVVYAYKKILKNNFQLLKVSSVSRPPVINKFESHLETSDEDNHRIIDIMDDWNKEYQYAQSVLDVSRSQLRSLITQDMVFKHNMLYSPETYNLDLKKFEQSCMNKEIPKSPTLWFQKRNGINNEAIDQIINFYVKRIYFEEREFLKNVIAKFVEVVEEELDDDGKSEIDKLNLIQFHFDDQKVTEWTQFYNEIINPTHGSRQHWPTLPPVCNYQNFNLNDDIIETQRTSNPTPTNQEEKEEVQKMLREFTDKYQSWWKGLRPDLQEKLRLQKPYMLRTWFFTRAWNAFRKAIQSNLVKLELKEQYMTKNRIVHQENKYLVLGSTMALTLPAASRPGYLVSFEHS